MLGATGSASVPPAIQLARCRSQVNSVHKPRGCRSAVSSGPNGNPRACFRWHFWRVNCKLKITGSTGKASGTRRNVLCCARVSRPRIPARGTTKIRKIGPRARDTFVAPFASSLPGFSIFRAVDLVFFVASICKLVHLCCIRMFISDPRARWVNSGLAILRSSPCRSPPNQLA
jgi:hypothetical protein